MPKKAKRKNKRVRNPKNGFMCEDPNCTRTFATLAGVAQHTNKAHPYVPPPIPPPRKTIQTEDGELFASNLLNARHQLELGDVFYHVRKIVITKRTETEGSNDIAVEGRVTRKWYTTEKPS